MKNVCILGVGLIGGSLGQALRRRGYHITGVGRSLSSLRQAKRLRAVDDFSTDLRSVRTADVVVLCVPVDKIVAFGKKVRPLMKKGAILTDAGSVKKEVVAKLRGPLFVGGHPIAGSEKSGVQNAQPTLFKGAVCVLTRDSAKKAALNRVAGLWRAAGAKVIVTSAAEHDRVLALTSHLPHLMAFALISLAQKDKAARAFLGPSFNEVTRIAASDPHIWTGILTMNRPELARRTNQFISTLRVLLRQSPQQLHKNLVAISQARQAR